jgi:hypothetical protein
LIRFVGGFRREHSSRLVAIFEVCLGLLRFLFRGNSFGNLASLLVLLFFFFRALGKILTVDNLRRRHIVVLDWCCICKCNGESVDHLLLQCPIAYEMCSMLFGVIWYILGYA